MQPTVRPWSWVSSWGRRARTRAGGELAHARDRLAPRDRPHDKYTFYGLRKDGRHFIRLDPLAKGLLLNRQWAATSAPVTWRGDRYHGTEPWAVPDIKVSHSVTVQSIQSYRPYEPVSLVLPGGRAGAAGAAGARAGGSGGAGVTGSHGWAHGARGWAAGAVLLALLVLLVRAAENCLHKKLFKALYLHTNVGAGEHQQDMMRGHYGLQGVRRQDSDEWSMSPNVMATSLQFQQRDLEAGASPAPRSPRSPRSPRASPPPPYALCALPPRDEPPPPYCACALPAVHAPTRNTHVDNVRNDLLGNVLRAESSTDDSGDVDPDARTEFIFDNGRIVERLSLDLNSNNETGAASDDVAEEQSTRHDFKDKVVYVDETALEGTTPDRALLV